MRLLTSVTLFVTLSVATSIYCAKGYYNHYTGESSIYETSCEAYTCKEIYNEESLYSKYHCGSCNATDNYYRQCYDCDWDMCNYDETSGAGHLPTTVSLLVPAAYFLAKLAE